MRGTVHEFGPEYEMHSRDYILTWKNCGIGAIQPGKVSKPPIRVGELQVNISLVKRYITDCSRRSTQMSASAAAVRPKPGLEEYLCARHVSMPDLLAALP